MYFEINKILNSFNKGCFSRQQTFSWFVIVVLGFIIRPDSLGVTSIIRAFCLCDLAYSCLINFFHSHAFEIDFILSTWCKTLARILIEDNLIETKNGRVILIGDGKNNPVEGKYIPLEKSLTSSSNNNKRRKSFLGHFFGCVGVLASCGLNTLCIPIFFSIQECHEIVLGWMGLESYNHSGSILIDAFRAAVHFGKSYLILDRYFLSFELLKLWRDHNRDNCLDLILRAKKSVVAFRSQHPWGKRLVLRNRVKVRELFDCPELFKQKKACLYGKKKVISYYCIDLFWDKVEQHKLRFVLSICEGAQSIFVTTDLSADPVSVIELYSRRMKIETCFKTFTNVFNGLFYHFWTKKVGKTTLRTDVYKKLSEITDPTVQQKIINKVSAIHTFVGCNVIAMGIVQILCLKYSHIDQKSIYYQRTFKKGILSENQMRVYLAQNLLSFSQTEPDLTISEIIRTVQAKYFFRFIA